MTYPLLLICGELLTCALAAVTEGLELLLVERQFVGGILVEFGLFVDFQFLSLFGFLLLVLLQLAYNLVLLPQRYPIALALCSPDSSNQLKMKITLLIIHRNLNVIFAYFCYTWP